MIIHIKNMVSERCKRAVENILDKLAIQSSRIDLGEVVIDSTTSNLKLKAVKAELEMAGFEILIDKKIVLIQKVKDEIIKMIHQEEDDELLKTNFSVFISDKMNNDYTYLSNLFSKELGITIEHFIIIHKIERIKELLSYDELSISEIAWKMNYSSVAHLSNQFKKETGVTPSVFKQQQTKVRQNIEDI
jgi:AraC-like DNA-binding protein